MLDIDEFISFHSTRGYLYILLPSGCLVSLASEYNSLDQMYPLHPKRLPSFVAILLDG